MYYILRKIKLILKKILISAANKNRKDELQNMSEI